MAKSEKRIKRKYDPAAAFHANLAMNQKRGCAGPPISWLCDNVLGHVLQLAEPDINIRQQLALVCKRWSKLTWTAASFTTSSRSRLTSRAIMSLVQWSRRQALTLNRLHQRMKPTSLVALSQDLHVHGDAMLQRSSLLAIMLTQLSLNGLSLMGAGSYVDWSLWLAVLSARPQSLHAPCNMLRLLTLSDLPASLPLETLASAVESLPHLEEISFKFDHRGAPDAGGSQRLMSSFCTCAGLRALRVASCCPLEAGQLPAALSTLQRLSVLQLRNVGDHGTDCVPHLPAVRQLVIHDTPAFPPVGEACLPGRLAAMTTMTALHTGCLNFDAGMPASLQKLTLDLTGWIATPELKDIRAFVQVSRLAALRQLHVSRCTESMCQRLPELLLSLNGLTQLQHVALRTCRLTALPPMSFLRRVTSLDLSSNGFTEVPEALKAATACRVLDLSHCLFSGPAGCLPVKDVGVFVHTTALRRLGLRRVIPPNVPAPQHVLYREVLSALQAVLASSCRQGEEASVITRANAAFPELDALAAEESPFQLEREFGN